MHNDTLTIILPVGNEVIKNVTNSFESDMLNMMLKAMRHLNLPGNHHNPFMTALILCLVLITAVICIIRYRLRRRCNNENEHDAAQLQVQHEC